jgi:hypothetical protein
MTAARSLILLIGLLSITDPVAAQPRKASEGVLLHGRWNAGALEMKIGDSPWVTKTQDLLKQIRATGATPETKISISCGSEVSWQAVAELIDFLKRAAYKDISVIAPLEGPHRVAPARSGKPGPPAKPAAPLNIEIRHAAGDCAAYAKERVCPTARHWSIRVDQTPCESRPALLEALRIEGAKQPDPTIRRNSARAVTVWAEAKAPHGLVMEVGVASNRAGFLDVIYDGEEGETAPPPELGGNRVSGTDESKAPRSVRLGVRWKDGCIEMRVDQGAWTASERHWMEQLRSRQATEHTHLVFDSAAEVPWSDMLRLQKRLKGWGFTEFTYLAPGFLLEGPVAPGVVTEAEAVDLARAIDRGFRNGDPTAFDRALYREELFRRAWGAIPLSVNMCATMDALAEGAVLSGKEVQKALGQAPALYFLSMRTAEDGPRPLFRLLLPHSVDYLEFVLGKTPDGKTRIVDVFSLASGELATATLRTTYLVEASALEVLNLLQVPTPLDVAMSSGILAPMLELFLDRKPKEALQYFAKNVETMKRSRPAYRLRILIAQQLGSDMYRQAIEEFEHDWPEDPSLTFLRVKRHLLTKNPEKGLAAIDALDRAVKGDPFLNVLRAELYHAGGDLAKARACAEKVTVDEPGLDRGWWAAIAVGLAQKDFAATAKFLSASEKALKITHGDLSEIPDYKEFVQSPEYREWIKSRK